MDKIDFLSEPNGAGQLLLRLVSRGNAILAELLRLSDRIPQGLFLSLYSLLFFLLYIYICLWVYYIAYRPESSQEYASLIFDFSYFNREELYEKRINDDSVCFSLLLLFFVLFSYFFCMLFRLLLNVIKT